jgi:predicted DNA-binding transcriptional regulator YafY
LGVLKIIEKIMSNFFDLKYRYDQVIRLIEAQNTGTPRELALKLNISERQLLRMICELRNSGKDIRYSRRDYTYYIK